MTKVTNITKGPKGVRNSAGAVVMLEAGQTEEVDLAEGETESEWFSFDGGDSASGSVDLKAAIELLDPANDSHWTSAGLPSVEAVSEIAGDKVTRAQIEEAAPGFQRPAAN